MPPAHIQPSSSCRLSYQCNTCPHLNPNAALRRVGCRNHNLSSERNRSLELVLHVICRASSAFLLIFPAEIYPGLLLQSCRRRTYTIACLCATRHCRHSLTLGRSKQGQKCPAGQNVYLASQTMSRSSMRSNRWHFTMIGIKLQMET